MVDWFVLLNDTSHPLKFEAQLMIRHRRPIPLWHHSPVQVWQFRRDLSCRYSPSWNALPHSHAKLVPDIHRVWTLTLECRFCTRLQDGSGAKSSVDIIGWCLRTVICVEKWTDTPLTCTRYSLTIRHRHSGLVWMYFWSLMTWLREFKVSLLVIQNFIVAIGMGIVVKELTSQVIGGCEVYAICVSRMECHRSFVRCMRKFHGLNAKGKRPSTSWWAFLRITICWPTWCPLARKGSCCKPVA